MRIARRALVACLLPALAAAQTASLKGRVLTDSTERPIAGVVISIPDLKLQATTDSLGNFLIPNVRPGAHIVSARKIGFGPLSTRVTFGFGETMEADLLLTATTAQPLPDVNVNATPTPHGKLIEFDERRLSGTGGRFLTQADLEKKPFSTLTDALRSNVPGIDFKRGTDGERGSFVVAGRSSLPVCAFCGGPKASGSMQPCYAAVILDGAFVYGAGSSGAVLGAVTSNRGEEEPKFDINSINPSTVAGIEYYAGPASMPVKYNGTRSTCGLLVIWTK
jgi:hypothetical protein